MSAATRAAAVALANAALAASRFDGPVVVGECRETARSFVFSTRAPAGGPLFGAPILAVDKASGAVRAAPEAFYEFFEDAQLTVRQRLARWWRRRRY